MSLVNAPIHDLLIRIKNAYMAKRTQVMGVPYSKFKEQVLQLLQQYRFIRGFETQTIENKKFLCIDLYVTGNMNEDVPVVKLYSKPSRRWYVGWKEIKPVASGKGIGILSTNQGLMAAHEAKTKKLGGELIAEIY
jgi:small subunit ribosomal protein S8